MATSARRSLEDEVTCSICIEHFKDPRVLSCLHSFCRHCLEELAVHSEGRGKLVCPLCKAEFKISPADVSSLPVNFAINRIFSVLALFTSEDSKKKTVCQMCDSGEPAQGRCNECEHTGKFSNTEEILERAKKVTSKLTDIEKAMALVEEAQQHLEENKRAARRDLDQFIDKQIGALEKMRSDLRGEIESACQKQEKQLTAQRENLSMRLASARSSLEFAERMCREANDVDVLSIRNEVLSQLSSLAEKPVDKPCMEGGVRLVVDQEYWSSMSKKISVDVSSQVSVGEHTVLEKSAILSGKGPEYLRDLLGFLQPVQQSPKSRWVRCFSAKRDGWAAWTFHEKCNDKAPNIVLVSVGGQYVFGGYSDVAWTMSDRKWLSSSRSFLFTLCNKNGYHPEKLPLRRTPNEDAICDYTRYGPVFGDGDLLIANNAGDNKVSSTEPNTYARPQGATSDGRCDVFAGTWNFTPDEMEVFHEVVD